MTAAIMRNFPSTRAPGPPATISRGHVSRQSGVPAASVAITAGLIAAIAVGALGCGSSTTSTTRSGGDLACHIGQPIGAGKGAALPPCTANEPEHSAFSYSCRTSPNTMFFIIYSDTIQLYGKPGGVWHQATGSTDFRTIRQQLNC
jgi:hypothetical protein